MDSLPKFNGHYQGKIQRKNRPKPVHPDLAAHGYRRGRDGNTTCNNCVFRSKTNGKTATCTLVWLPVSIEDVCECWEPRWQSVGSKTWQHLIGLGAYEIGDRILDG